jgi:hypothetical protein
VLLGALACAAGCKASVRGNVNVGARAQVAEFDEPLDPTAQSTTPAEPDEGAPAYALLGARHDVRLSASGQPNCACLAVALGQPNDPAFDWQSIVPKTNPETQLVIALSADGIECAAAPKDSLGASYWGWRREGDHVVVLVENARFGRPLTAGGVIPKPMGEGQVWVRAAGKDVPYGRPLDTTRKDCRIGNPGAPRTSALSPDEDPRDDVGPMHSEEPDDEFVPAD